MNSQTTSYTRLRIGLIFAGFDDSREFMRSQRFNFGSQFNQEREGLLPDRWRSFTTMIYVGIDNGISGAIVLLSKTAGCAPLAMTPMPIQKAKKNEVDIAIVKAWLWEIGSWDKFTICLEEPSGSKSAQAAASMAASFGALRGAFQWAGIRFHRIGVKKWQREMLGSGVDDTKKAALTKAKEIWPGETWLASPRCKVPHDGMVDAALIAEYARRNRL